MPSESPTASRKTTLEWPSEKKKPTLSGRWPSRHQLARRVVDRADVVGVERVAHAERVGRDADADAEDAAAELQVLRRDEAEQQAEADDVQRDDHEREQPARASTRPARASATPASIAIFAHRYDVAAIGLFPPDHALRTARGARAIVPLRTALSQPIRRYESLATGVPLGHRFARCGRAVRPRARWRSRSPRGVAEKCLRTGMPRAERARAAAGARPARSAMRPSAPPGSA